MNCLAWGKKAAVHDFAGKYGDWLFKQPLLLGLRKEGVRLRASGNPYPMRAENSAGIQPDWALVVSRADRKTVDAAFARGYPKVLELRRTGRSSEEAIFWRNGRIAARKAFRAEREQERVRAVAAWLGIPYEERSVEVPRPRGRTVAVSLAAGERGEERLRFDFREMGKAIRLLRERGYEFKVIEAKGERNPDVLAFHKLFRAADIVRTKNFAEGCAVIRSCDFYFGADSGLAHYAVEEGKIACALFSRAHHGAKPLFQSTFRNHLSYFGDRPHAAEIIRDLDRLAERGIGPRLTRVIGEFLRTGRGIDPDPYSNARKLFVLNMSFASQGEHCAKMAREIHARSASIFFTDEVMSADAEKAKPLRGKLFIDSRAFVEELAAVLARGGDASKISMRAKECSLFYGTAMRDGSSDVDLPALVLPKRRPAEPLLRKVAALLDAYGFSTELPHQVPVASSSARVPRGFRPIIRGGRIAYAQCRQRSPENMQKYEARLKLKIVMGEMRKEERAWLESRLPRDASGRRLLREIKMLERDARRFKEWRMLIRKICRATSSFGKFGAKGHVFLRVKRKDCPKVAGILGGLMRHGVVYMAGERVYPVWNIRRPQHGWFQPITLLAEDWRPFRFETQKALRSPVYSAGSFAALKRLASGKARKAEIVLLLESRDPLVFMEAYRAIAEDRERFAARPPVFSREDLRAYAAERESNCNSPRDRRLSLWSLATGKPLPLDAKDIARLTKYNCFAQVLAGNGLVRIPNTSLFDRASRIGESAKNFTAPFRERLVKLLREYYLYSLCAGIPPEFLYEKRKEILFCYCVQGRVLLEGPRAQSREGERILREFDILKILQDGRALREAIIANPGAIPPSSGEFLLSWLLRNADLDSAKFFARREDISRYVALPSAPAGE